jgi:hypothetical protein
VLHLKKNGKQAIIPTAEFGIISAETACWENSQNFNEDFYSLPSSMGRLVYRGRDSSAEGQTRKQRGRLVYGGGDSSTEGESRLRRGRLVYKGSSRDYTIDAIGNVQNGPNTVYAEYTYIYDNIYVHICRYIYRYICMFVCMYRYVCMYVCMYVCKYVCLIVYMYLCMYVFSIFTSSSRKPS